MSNTLIKLRPTIFATILIISKINGINEIEDN